MIGKSLAFLSPRGGVFPSQPRRVSPVQGNVGGGSSPHSTNGLPFRFAFYFELLLCTFDISLLLILFFFSIFLSFFFFFFFSFFLLCSQFISRSSAHPAAVAGSNNKTKQYIHKMEAARPQSRPHHHGDKLGAKLVDRTEKLHDQALAMKGSAPGDSAHDHEPAGGFDSTPIPHAPPGYTLRFTFHRGDNLPFADFGTFSSDPYVVAQLMVNLPQRHKQDPGLFFRTPTVRKNLDPVWNSEWIVANVPASGFELKCCVLDEDAADHDDKLGNAYVHVNTIGEDWPGIKEQQYKVKKRMGSKRVYIFGNLAALASRRMDPGSYLVISVECLGKTPGNVGGQVYTLGPNYWFKHFSPLIGRLAGTKDEVQGEDGKRGVSRYKCVVFTPSL